MAEQSKQTAGKIIQAVMDSVENPAAVDACRRLVDAFRKEEYRHSVKVEALTVKEENLQDRVEALKVLYGELSKAVNEMRDVYQDQLIAKRTLAITQALDLDPLVAQFMRSARLLLEPGRAIKKEVFRALGVKPPPKGKRPTEHFARQIAAYVLPVLGFEVLKAQGDHPDLICRYEGKIIGVEVEVGLENYNSHKHDSADSSAVVVWKNPQPHQLKDGWFAGKKCTAGYSNLMSVISLQKVRMSGCPLRVGKKRKVDLDGWLDDDDG